MMNVIDLPQRTPAWLEWRAGGVSASDVAILLGLSPFKTPWRLWAEKTGLVRSEAELSSDWFRNKGTGGEDAVRWAFEEKHDTMLLALCGESEEQPLIRASFDGIDDDGRPVELKVSCQKVYMEVLDLGRESTAYKLYWPQVQTQLYVSGQTLGWLVFYYGPGAMVEFEVERDEVFIAQTLVPGCLDFWAQIQNKKEPPRDPERDLYTPKAKELETWTLRAAEYRKAAAAKTALDNQVKTLKASIDVIEESLVAMMGDFLVAETAGIKVLRYAQRGLIAYKDAVAVLLPELDPAVLETYRGALSDRVKVTVLKEEKAQVPFDEAKVEAVLQTAEDDKGCFF
ncbi:lambda-exonuclease family protein [uncultured Thiodictyon sp.]|uniref:YqaJ viral recombinase family nuclease n=1 Tax=uncultured Thiodictyon sp. TaxID=1846217 RepID=UPI0026013B8E|nr:YqaJ viral recombinase family protein [uncultured Thiodictyon sp.]